MRVKGGYGVVAVSYRREIEKNHIHGETDIILKCYIHGIDKDCDDLMLI